VLALGRWGFGFAASFLLLSLIPPGVSAALLWKTHAAAAQNEVFAVLDVYKFDLKSAAALHAEVFGGAVLGFYLALFRSRLSSVVFATALAATAVLVHFIHRPWWWYYYLHLAIPLSMLCGVGFTHLWRLLGAHAIAKGNSVLLALPRFAVCLGAIALLVTSGWPRVVKQWAWLREAPTIDKTPVIQAMLRYRDGCRWMYCLDPKFSFFIRVPIPPELAILSAKRFATKQITYARILEVLRKYEPEEILLTTGEEFSPDWTSFLNAGYEKTYEDTRCTLYVSKRLRRDLTNPESRAPGRV